MAGFAYEGVMTLLVGSLKLTADELMKGFHEGASLGIDPEVRRRMERSREVVERESRPAYGINTGIGLLKDRRIATPDLTKLSRNILLSHACGTGQPLAPEISKLMLLLRIHNLALGFSGVRPTLVEKLIELYEKEVFGVVYEHGSVGSSGDLVPLAHIALPLLGEGEVWDGGQIRPAREVLKRKEILPLELASKEGISLINGTQFMTAHGLLALQDGQKLLTHADLISCLTLEALRGSRTPFHPFLHERRPIPELQQTAEFLWDLLEGSEILESHKDCGEIQDAYSLRCIPQIHGSCRLASSHLRKILDLEVRSSTDNPLISLDKGEILSGGNFHGEPLAGALDYLAITFTKLSAVSERRIARLLDSNHSHLPPFLAENGGLNSGLMIAQYTAASLVSENKVLAHPAAADSIPTAANQEDLNSMGSISAKKLLKILQNTEQVVGIELLAALQALDLSLKGQPSLKTSPLLERIRRYCRERIPFLSEDVYLKPHLDKAIELVRSGSLLSLLPSRSS